MSSPTNRQTERISGDEPSGLVLDPSDDWSDVSPEELAELETAAVAAEEELRAGRCIPAEEVLPLLRRAG